VSYQRFGIKFIGLVKSLSSVRTEFSRSLEKGITRATDVVRVNEGVGFIVPRNILVHGSIRLSSRCMHQLPSGRSDLRFTARCRVCLASPRAFAFPAQEMN
jgi:hypothetical protein